MNKRTLALAASLLALTCVAPTGAVGAMAPTDLSGAKYAPPGYFYTHSSATGGGWADAALLARGLKQLDPASPDLGGGWADLASVRSSTASGSASASAHAYTAKLISRPLSTANGYPNPGGTAFIAGSVRMKPFGAGALLDRITVTGHPQANVFEFKGTELIFLANGTQRDSFTGTDTIGDDGGQHVSVNGRYTGGTGRYRGATGRYTFEGSVPSGSDVLSGASHGRVVF